ncbi:hypothetical protein MTO96_019896 [Rhipicephalus appendiculatus]
MNSIEASQVNDLAQNTPLQRTKDQESGVAFVYRGPEEGSNGRGLDNGDTGGRAAGDALEQAPEEEQTPAADVAGLIGAGANEPRHFDSDQRRRGGSAPHPSGTPASVPSPATSGRRRDPLNYARKSVRYYIDRRHL